MLLLPLNLLLPLSSVFPGFFYFCELFIATRLDWSAECLCDNNSAHLPRIRTFISAPNFNLLSSNTYHMYHGNRTGSVKRKQSVSSLSDYAANIKKTMGPKSTARWGRRLDKESRHNFGNVTGNEDIGGCNPDYKFPESFFNEEEDGYFWPPSSEVKKTGKLYWTLRDKHGAPYGSYKSLLGEWTVEENIQVIFDRIQSDPFAPPSNIRIRIPQDWAKFPYDLMVPKIRNIASCDLIARTVSRSLTQMEEQWASRGSKRRGFHITKPTQYVLERKSVLLTPEFVELRLYAHMPANGRRIDGRYASKLFSEVLPDLCRSCLQFEAYDSKNFYSHVECVEDQQHLRNSLEGMGLVAFVANGASLPRESGVSHKPMKSPDLKLFKSPESLEVTIKTPNRGEIVGMGIKSGVTVVVGGGYHGKTTLLEALQLGIYNKVMGDGREFVVTSPNCVKIRAEDGRSVNKLDISTFIGDLPNGKSGRDFSTKDASGSTSQAAGIMESVEMGADLFLIDEDISASNFMYRDKLMHSLVSKDKEPITPFLSLVRPFYDKLNVSTILVSGSCGLFATEADLVLQMDEYNCIDITEEAKKLLAAESTYLAPKASGDSKLFQGLVNSRMIGKATFKRQTEKIKQFGMDKIKYGTVEIDLDLVDQLVEVGQTCTITNIITHLEDLYKSPQSRNRTLRELLDELYDSWNRNREVGFTGLDQVNGFKHFPTVRPNSANFVQGDCTMPRIFEVAAAINRLRTLTVTDFVETKYKPQEKWTYTD